MTQYSQQPAKRPRGVGDFLWAIYGMWTIGAGLAFMSVLTTRGAEVLNMPTWAWFFALIASVGAAAIYGVAKVMGDTKDVRFVSMACGLIVFALSGVCFMTGFFDAGREPVAAASGLIDFGDAARKLGRFIAWVALVGAPAIAFIANGCIVLALRKQRAAVRASAPSAVVSH